MKFEINDKVRIKKSKALEKLYGNPSHECWSACKDIVMDVDGSEVSCAKSGDWVNGALQLILESSKLSLRLSQKGLTLKVKILHQDESLRGVGVIVEHKNFAIGSGDFPYLSIYTLHLKGNERKYDDDKIIRGFTDQEELDNFVSALRIMMKDDKLI